MHEVHSSADKGSDENGKMAAERYKSRIPLSQTMKDVVVNQRLSVPLSKNDIESELEEE